MEKLLAAGDNAIPGKVVFIVERTLPRCTDKHYLTLSSWLVYVIFLTLDDCKKCQVMHFVASIPDKAKKKLCLG